MFEQLVVGGKVELFKKSRRIKENGETKEMLLDITEDGVIDENEKPQLEEILKNLEEVEEIAQSMKLWIKKNL